MRPIAVASSSTTMGARPSSGSSSNSKAGLVISARADRQHLLLAAGQLVAEIASPFGQAREEVVDRRRVQRPGARGDGEILVDRQRGEYLALLRDPADAGARAPVRRQRRDVLPRHTIRPRPIRVCPMRVSKQRRLADAVAAEHGERLPRCGTSSEMPSSTTAVAVAGASTSCSESSGSAHMRRPVRFAEIDLANSRIGGDFGGRALDAGCGRRPSR